MYERKLQFTGGSSFITSLPKDWVGKQGLKAGSSVYVTVEKDGSLRVSPKRSDEASKEITINAGSLKGTLPKIIAAYIAGADTIIVKGKDTAEVCEEARLRLSGLEIVEEHKEKSVMRVLAHEEDLHFPTLLRRLYLVSDVMCHLALRTLEKGENVSLEAGRRDNDADRLYILIMRCLYNTHGRYSPMKAIAARTIERVADHAERICMSEKRVLPNAGMANILTDALTLYHEAYKCLMESRLDDDLFDRQAAMLTAAEKRADAIIKGAKDRESAIQLKATWESCRRIFNYSLNIAEIAANMSYVGEKTVEV